MKCSKHTKQVPVNDEDHRWPIDHENIIDGFRELAEHKYYLGFDGRCGTCGDTVHVPARIQKHLLEQRGVPFKFLFRGAILCLPCRYRQAAINRFKRAAGQLLPVEREKFDRLREIKMKLKLKIRNSKMHEDELSPYGSKGE